MKDLTEGKPLKVIGLFAIPIFIGYVFQLAYGIIDIRVVGSLLGKNSLAAVSSVSTLNDLLLNFTNGFFNGFGIIIATYFGAKNFDRVRKSAGNSGLLGLLITLALTAVCVFFLSDILSLLNVNGAIYKEARSYIFILISGLIFSAGYNYCASVLRSVGDAVTPLVFLIVSNVMNGVLDYVLVKYTSLGVRGAAYATVIAQAVSAVICFIYMYAKYPILRIKISDIIPEASLVKELVPSGISMSFMSSFVFIGTVSLQIAINGFGENIIIAHTGARKVGSIFMGPFAILSITLATFCGQNFGAKKIDRIKKGIIDSNIVLFFWCLFSAVFLFFFSKILVGKVTASTDSEVLETAQRYLRVNSALYFIPSIICTVRQSMQGFGDRITPIISSFIELAGKVIFAFLLAPVMGYWAIIISEPVVWILMIIPLLIGMKKAFKKWSMENQAESN